MLRSRASPPPPPVNNRDQHPPVNNRDQHPPHPPPPSTIAISTPPPPRQQSRSAPPPPPPPGPVVTIVGPVIFNSHWPGGPVANFPYCLPLVSILWTHCSSMSSRCPPSQTWKGEAAPPPPPPPDGNTCKLRLPLKSIKEEFKVLCPRAVLQFRESNDPKIGRKCRGEAVVDLSPAGSSGQRTLIENIPQKST